MKRTERTVIYAALIVLAAFNAIFLLSHSGQRALAEAASWLDSLGPADSLILVDNGKEMEVRNRGGRVAYGTGDFKQTYSVAFVDISKALNPLMEAEQYTEERDTLRKELEEKEAEYKTQLDAFGEQLQGADQSDPATQEKFAAAQKVYQEYLEWGQQAMERRNTLDAEHLQKAYRDLVSAVDVVADKLGVDIVLRFIPTAQDFKATDAEAALTEIRLRTAVKYPDALDITSEVLEELSLQNQDG
jgi:Skp family chaperone for outer membrane proteins